MRTLLADCSTPYLIGVDTCLLREVLGRGKGQGNVHGKVAELLPLAVVVDLDAGTVHHPAATSWFKPSQPPVLSLVRELSGCMGDVMQFRPAAAQAACLRFVVDALNLSAGFLARSPAPADAEAASRLQLLRRYEELDQDPNADMPQKMLTFYELDLGLNHITRKFAEPVPIMFSFVILDAEPIFTSAFFVDPSS